MTSVSAASTTAPQRSARRWPWFAAVALVVALVVGWQVLARAPRLEPGSFAMDDLEAVDEPGTGFAVTDPADGTYDGMWSFRNTGPVPVTIRVAQPPDDGSWQQNQLVRSLELVPVDPETGQVFWDDTVGSVRLGPGDEVGVRYTLGAGCWLWEAGVGYGASSAVLEVSALGVTRAVTAEARTTSWVRWTDDLEPVAGCS